MYCKAIHYQLLSCFVYNIVITFLCAASLLDDIHVFELLAALLPARGNMNIVQRFVVSELQTEYILYICYGEREMEGKMLY